MRVFDAVSGGDPLLVLDAGDEVRALVIQGPGGGRAAACERIKAQGEKVRLRPGRGRRGAGRARGAHQIYALTAFTGPGGRSRAAAVSGANDVRVWNPAASGAAIEAEPEGHSDDVEALVTFVDPATGALSRPGRMIRRFACGRGDWRRVARD